MSLYNEDNDAKIEAFIFYVYELKAKEWSNEVDITGELKHQKMLKVYEEILGVCHNGPTLARLRTNPLVRCYIPKEKVKELLM